MGTWKHIKDFMMKASDSQLISHTWRPEFHSIGFRDILVRWICRKYLVFHGEIHSIPSFFWSYIECLRYSVFSLRFFFIFFLSVILLLCEYPGFLLIFISVWLLFFLSCRLAVMFSKVGCQRSLWLDGNLAGHCLPFLCVVALVIS